MIKLLKVFVLRYYEEKMKSPIDTKLLRFILLKSWYSVNIRTNIIVSLLNILYRRKSVTF